MSSYKPISNTYVFEQYRGKVLDVIQDSLTEGEVLTQVQLEEQFVLIKKYVKSALKPKILSELQSGRIKLIYAPDSVMKMSSVPFVMTKNNGELCANVFVSSFGNRRVDGQVNVDYRKLYALMESAYMARQFVSKYDRFKNNGAILQGCILYANMFAKPINKKFNLHLDKTKENYLLFLAAKFYLINVVGLTNEDIIFNTAMKACKAGNPILLKEADLQIDIDAFKNLGTFIEALKDDTLNLGLSTLTGRGFLENYISLYGGAAVFALEMFPYFLFVINATINSMGLVNNYSLEDLVEKQGPKILTQFYA